MKRFALPILSLLLLFVASCLENDHYEAEQGSRYFIYKNTIPYYFYDSTGNSIITFNNWNTYPLSYVGSLPSKIEIEAATSTNQFLSNYDGVGIDTAGRIYWYSYNKGCYDSTHFTYNVRTPYLHDTIDIEYKFDTVSTYDLIIYVHKLTYNGVVIRAYEEDSTKLITADHVDVFKYKDKTVVKPVYKEKTTTTK